MSNQSKKQLLFRKYLLFDSNETLILPGQSEGKTITSNFESHGYQPG
jgi:hypothetical protein